jgi:hypothetical protein
VIGPHVREHAEGGDHEDDGHDGAHGPDRGRAGLRDKQDDARGDGGKHKPRDQLHGALPVTFHPQ